ncbi:MAG: nitroreductase family protein [Jatrophihabitantaceae bacterium]
MAHPATHSSESTQREPDSAGPFRHAVLETVIATANRAPSIHNTQPWRWQLHADHLSLRADRNRQLRIADPDGHSLLISCGAALVLTELGLRALGWEIETSRLPDPADPDLLAEFRVTGPGQLSTRDLELLAAAQRRQSDRRPFRRQEIAPQDIEALRGAAAGGGVHADFPERQEQRVNLAVAVSSADRSENQDSEYVAERNRWSHDSDVRADGVPATAIPHVPAGKARHTDVPLRDFETGVSGRLLIERDVDERPVIAVLLTESDSALEQLRAGESMMRLMLEAQVRGLASCPLSQAVDLVAFRSRIRTLMGWQGFPQMMLRLGYPALDAAQVAETPRRPVADVLDVAPGVQQT